MPVIVKLPAPVAEMLADDCRQTPVEYVPVPHEVPLTVSEPEVVVTLDLIINIPLELSVPFAAVPVIVTFPALVAEMFADVVR